MTSADVQSSNADEVGEEVAEEEEEEDTLAVAASLSLEKRALLEPVLASSPLQELQFQSSMCLATKYASSPIWPRRILSML